MTDKPDEKLVRRVAERLPRRAMIHGVSVATAATALAAMPGRARAADAGPFPAHPQWRFVFVNHVTTNPFFVPTQYGIHDACALLGCTYQWTGSEISDVAQMVNAMNAAIAAKADGIAVAIVDPKGFDAPVARALDAGIPVFSYNADSPPGSPNRRLAYIGQDLYLSGYQMGERIVKLVGSGDVALFIATPGQLNIQPRINGAADAIKKEGGSITYHEVATGPTINEELSTIQAYYLGHKSLKGMFAVDAGSTECVGHVMRQHDLPKQGIQAGGFDLLPDSLNAVHDGYLDFVIDQQPYLQGFYTVMELFAYKVSGGLVGPADINTGLKFVTKGAVEPYLQTKTRYEGSSAVAQIVPRSGPIAG
ncbi:MAG TPA: sugar ABC transporter substrate-binding protein [Acetobacteraceae bacterium]|nr:sugar ABC transporter substrate-binding protein [Acetobacteraceae bacterium]